MAECICDFVYDCFVLFRQKPMVNLEVKKDMAKVVDSFDIEDVGDKAVYCRCWRSAKVRDCSV